MDSLNDTKTNNTNNDKIMTNKASDTPDTMTPKDTDTDTNAHYESASPKTNVIDTWQTYACPEVGLIFIERITDSPSVYKIDVTYDFDDPILENPLIIVKRPLYFPEGLVETLFTVCSMEPFGTFKIRSDLGEGDFIQTTPYFMTSMFNRCWVVHRDQQTEFLIRAGLQLQNVEYDDFFKTA